MMVTKSKKKKTLILADQESENKDKAGETTPETQVGNEAIASVNIAEPQTIEDDLSEDEMDMEKELPETEPVEEKAEDSEIAPTLELDANLSIQNVVKLYDKLKRIYAAHDAIEIDASHVSSVDTASLQLFVALKKDAIKQNKSVDFFQPSPRFVESARLLDLLDVLEIMDV